MSQFAADWLKSCRRTDFNTSDPVAWIARSMPLASLVAEAYATPNPQGRPPKYDRVAMTVALLCMLVESIRHFEALARRLHNDDQFAERCGFARNAPRPHGWDLRRHYNRLAATDFGTRLQQALVDKACDLGLVTGEIAASDSAAIHTRERYRKSDGPSATLTESQRRYHNLLQARQRRQDVLVLSSAQLAAQLPTAPGWGMKTNSRGQLERWFGYKVHVAIDAGPHEIPLRALVTGANCNDLIAAYPLALGVRETLPQLRYRYWLYDRAYDAGDLYRFHEHHGTQMLAELNWRDSDPPRGFNRDMHPLCWGGMPHSYHSYDAERETIRFGAPTVCAGEACCWWDGCPSRERRVERSDLRLHLSPPRGSATFRRLHDRRSAAERTMAGLKDTYRGDACLLRGASRVQFWVSLALAVWTGRKITLALQARQRGRPVKRPRPVLPVQLCLDRHAPLFASA